MPRKTVSAGLRKSSARSVKAKLAKARAAKAALRSGIDRDLVEFQDHTLTASSVPSSPLATAASSVALTSSLTSSLRGNETMTSAKPRLLYFDCKSRGELSRLLFAAAGKPYEDVRIDRIGDEWPKIKPTFPFRQLPVLEIDGQMYPQSLAISNYLAKEFGLYGKTTLEQLQIDGVIQLVQEIFPMIEDAIHTYYDKVKEEEMKEQVAKEHAPKYLDFFEQLLKEEGTGYFVGNSLTVADLAVFDLMTSYMVYLGVQANAEKHQRLLAHMKKVVEENPGIKAYVTTRKDTPY